MSKNPTPGQFRWLTESIARQIFRAAKQAEARQLERCFYWATEATIVSFIEDVFRAHGFNTCREHKFTRPGRPVDLWAEDPSNRPDYVIEVKAVWDGEDERLNPSSLTGGGDLLADFSKLRDTNVPRDCRKLVIWVVFSPDEDLPTERQGRRQLGAGSALELVKKESGLTLEDLRWKVIGKGDWQYAHVFCWEVA